MRAVGRRRPHQISRPPGNDRCKRSGQRKRQVPKHLPSFFGTPKNYFLASSFLASAFFSAFSAFLAALAAGLAAFLGRTATAASANVAATSEEEEKEDESWSETAGATRILKSQHALG